MVLSSVAVEQNRRGEMGSTWRGRGLSKSFISRLIIGVTPSRVLITLLITIIPIRTPFGILISLLSTYNLLTKSPAPPSSR